MLKYFLENSDMVIKSETHGEWCCPALLDLIAKTVVSDSCSVLPVVTAALL